MTRAPMFGRGGADWRHWARTRRQQHLTGEVLTNDCEFLAKRPWSRDDGLGLLLLELETIRRQVGSLSAHVAKAPDLSSRGLKRRGCGS